MRCLLLGVAILGSGAWGADALAQQSPRADSAGPFHSHGGRAGANGEEPAIRAVAAPYTKAYNSHDAKGVAALFTPDAEIVDPRATRSRAVRPSSKCSPAVFQENPQSVHLDRDQERCGF